MSKSIIAIDPGASGGFVYRDKTEYVQCWPMPETRRDLIDKLKQIVTPQDINGIVAYIEAPNSFIPDGSPSRMCEFGKAIERPSCILETLGVRIIEVTPQRWQKHLNLGKSGRIKITAEMSKEEKKRLKAENGRIGNEWKGKLKSEAQRRFPQVKGITLKTSDCLLILEYAISQEAQRLP